MELPQNNQISAQESQTNKLKYYKEIFNSKHGRQPKRVKFRQQLNSLRKKFPKKFVSVKIVKDEVIIYTKTLLIKQR